MARKLKQRIFNNTARLIPMEQFAAYTSLGMNSARKLANESGAIIRIGGCVRVDRLLADQYIDAMSRMEA